MLETILRLTCFGLGGVDKQNLPKFFSAREWSGCSSGKSPSFRPKENVVNILAQVLGRGWSIMQLMSDLTKLQNLVIDFRDARDWKQFHNPKDLALSLVLESAELMEHFQWKTEKEVQKHLVTNKAAVSEELADVFYWVLLIANDLDIDLNTALKEKLKQNDKKYPIAKSKGKHTKYTEL